MEIDTKIRKIIEDINENKIDYDDIEGTVGECIELLKDESIEKEYLDRYIKKIENLHAGHWKHICKYLHRSQRHRVLSDLNNILKNSRYNTEDYMSNVASRVFKAIQFKDNIEQVKAFCEGRDNFEKGWHYKIYDLVIEEIKCNGIDIYSVKYFGDHRFTPAGFLFRDGDMISRSTYSERLYIWSMPLESFKGVYFEYPDNLEKE